MSTILVKDANGTNQTAALVASTGQTTAANSLPVVLASDQTLPLPTGAATAAGVAAVVTALGTPLQAGGSVAVSNFPATQPVSAGFATPIYIADAYTNAQSVTWSSATAVNTANTVNTAGMDGVLLSFIVPAGITGGAVVFEAYDGTNWVPIQAGKMNTYGGSTGLTFSGALTVGYQLNTAGSNQFRTRLTTAITGTGNIVIAHLVSSATMPDPVTVGLDPAQPLPAGSNNIGIVSSPLAAPVTGQAKIATTGTAVALASNVLVNGVVVKAKSTNAATIFVGGATVTSVYDGTGPGYPLAPGEAMSFAVSNSNSLYINGTANDVVSFGGN